MRACGFVHLLAAGFVAALAIVMAPSAGAQTRKATAQETRLIRDCVDQKSGSGKGEQCIGLVSSRCMKKPGGDAGLNRADCYRVEREVWDAVLNEKYQELQGDLDEDQKTRAREMQRAWIASRDATCAFYHHKIQGSMAVPMTASCLLTETARRALLLITFSGV
jgi:uncharacterized protein YecT (DUF1311 family)